MDVTRDKRFKKRNLTMGLFVLMLGAGLVFGLGAAATGILGGVLVGAGVIALSAVAWKMGKRGFYADLEYYEPERPHEGCECPFCEADKQPPSSARSSNPHGGERPNVVHDAPPQTNGAAPHDGETGQGVSPYRQVLADRHAEQGEQPSPRER